MLTIFFAASAVASTFSETATVAVAVASPAAKAAALSVEPAKKTWGLSANYLAQKNGVSIGETVEFTLQFVYAYLFTE